MSACLYPFAIRRLSAAVGERTPILGMMQLLPKIGGDSPPIDTFELNMASVQNLKDLTFVPQALGFIDHAELVWELSPPELLKISFLQRASACA